tara:strand:- start:485 stop:631 length:147 start_codon:yes stop_codon:yes gene_type:complete
MIVTKATAGGFGHIKEFGLHLGMVVFLYQMTLAITLHFVIFFKANAIL